MHKTLLAIVVIAAAGVSMIANPAPADAQQLPYIAGAANHIGYGFGQGYSMEQARQNALHQCYTRTGAPCPRSLSTSERNHWHLSIVRCANGYSTGMSPQGWDRAYAIAVSKIGGFSCEEVRAE